MPSWYYRKGYITAMADLIMKELIHYSADDMKVGLHVLFR